MKKKLKIIPILIIAIIISTLLIFPINIYAIGALPSCSYDRTLPAGETTWTWSTPCGNIIESINIETGYGIFVLTTNALGPNLTVNGIGTSTVEVIEGTWEVYRIKYYYDCCPSVPSVPSEPEPWVRTMPMTCWQVFINEDNDFQFIFWYPYKDKNWVRIYDMEDNMVFEVDLPKYDPNLIVDLPDGMYMVRTYHDQELLQEFLIGKP